MNTLIDEIYQTKIVYGQNGEQVAAFPTSIPQDEGIALYNIVRSIKARRTLEIGMAYGLSTLYMCQAHQDAGADGGSHVSIDPYQTKWWKSIGLRNLERCGLSDYLEFHESMAHESLPRMLERGDSYDLIFIDGGHLFDHTMLEFFYADLLIPIGGYVMFDDLWMPSQQAVVSFILNNRDYIWISEFSPPVPNTMTKLTQTTWKIGAGLLAGHLPVRGPLDTHYGRGSDVRWCVLKKVGADQREWNHFCSF